MGRSPMGSRGRGTRPGKKLDTSGADGGELGFVTRARLVKGWRCRQRALMAQTVADPQDQNCARKAG